MTPEEFLLAYIFVLLILAMMSVIWVGVTVWDWWQGRELRALIRSHDYLFEDRRDRK